MAVGYLASPGTEYGPCLNRDCGHTDCAMTREDAEALCGTCHEPIGYDRAFYVNSAKRPNRVLVHAVCLEKLEV
jgi:hypothetical protein